MMVIGLFNSNHYKFLNSSKMQIQRYRFNQVALNKFPNTFLGCINPFEYIDQVK